MKARPRNGDVMEERASVPLDQEKLVAFLATQPDVVAVYLFGSHAQEQAHPRSDIDIAVLLREDADATWGGKRHLALMGEMERFTDRKVDVVMLNTAPPILQHQVLKYGRLLYERDPRARVEFEVRAGKIYSDLKPMYDFFTEAMFREMQEVGLGGRRRRRSRTTPVTSE